MGKPKPEIEMKTWILIDSCVTEEFDGEHVHKNINEKKRLNTDFTVNMSLAGILKTTF